MWLRNLCVFLGTADFSVTAAALENALASAPCPACGEQTVSVGGFVPPIAGDAAMTRIVDGLAVCRYQTIERLLPSAVIAEEVNELVEAIQSLENRRVGRREKADIKDQAHFELLPRAFKRTKHTTLIVDLRGRQIWVDTASQSIAEHAVAALRVALGTLPVTRPAPRVRPTSELSNWISKESAPPDGFECGDRCLLESEDDMKSSMRITSMDLQRDEIRAHLAAGMQATRLNVCVDDAIEFDVDEHLDLKRIRALDLIQDDLDAIEPEDAVAELNARLAIQGEAIRSVLARLHTHFGVVASS